MTSNLFETCVPAEQISRRFAEVRDHPRFEPARDLMNAVFARMPKPEKNFITDLQTVGFDARVWELYLFAALTFTGFDVTQPHEQPDFLSRRFSESAWIEAVTANPSQGATQTVEIPIQRIMDDLLPIRYGTPLRRKLSAEYWKRPHVAGKPFVIALADFADEDPLRWSHSGLHRYLYGKDLTLSSELGEPVEATVSDVTKHAIGKKSIESNFFHLDGAEHISAVVFSNSGTVMKFNRMGFDRQRYPNVLMVRTGVEFDPDPRAIVLRAFAEVVGEVAEAWLEGMVTFHNMLALQSLSSSFFQGTPQYRGADSARVGSERHPISSLTKVFVKPQGEAISASEEEELRQWVRETAEVTEAVIRKSTRAEYERQTKKRTCSNVVTRMRLLLSRAPPSPNGIPPAPVATDRSSQPPDTGASGSRAARSSAPFFISAFQTECGT
jgi:hypothetical protein